MGNGRIHTSLSFVAAFLLATAIIMAPSSAATVTPGPQSDQPGFVGTISGVVRDDKQNGVPGAEVTLYDCVNINGKYENRFKVDTPNNPQLSSEDGKPIAGLFVFTGVSRGTYNLTVTKDGHTASQIVSVFGGTMTQDIGISGYVYGTKPSPTPTVVHASPQPTAVPVKQDNTNSDLLSIYEVLKILAMTAIGAQLVFCLVVLALFANNKR